MARKTPAANRPGAQLVADFCEAFDRGAFGTPGTGEARAILEEMRNRLLLTVGPDAVSADTALRMARAEGRPNEKAKHLILALEVRKEMDGSASREIAFERVATAFHTSVSSVKTAHEKYGKEAKAKVAEYRAAPAKQRQRAEDFEKKRPAYQEILGERFPKKLSDEN